MKLFNLYSLSITILFINSVLNNGISSAEPVLTSAQKLMGFSGRYGLGGNLGGITLNDIGYDLHSTFSRACRDVGIDLGLHIAETGAYPLAEPSVSKWITPNVYDSAPKLSDIDLSEFLTQINARYQVNSDEELSEVVSEYASPTPKLIADTEAHVSGPEVLLSSGSSGYKINELSEHSSKLQLQSTPVYPTTQLISSSSPVVSDKSAKLIGDWPTTPYVRPGWHLPSTKDALGSRSPAYLSTGWDLSSLKDRLVTKLIELPKAVAPDYSFRSDGPKHLTASGYSAHIIHAANPKSYKPIIGGKSKVFFTKLHTKPSKIFSTPVLDRRTQWGPTLVKGLDDFSPFAHEYPNSYKTAITHTTHGSHLSGGYGRALTGSYGSMLTNGYKRMGLLSDGGLKGLKFSY